MYILPECKVIIVNFSYDFDWLVETSYGYPLISRKRIHISGGLDSILIFIKHFCPYQKYLKLLFSS